MNKNKLARVTGSKSKWDFFFILTSADDGDDAGEKKVSVSVLEDLVSEKSIGIGIAKLGIEKSLGFGQNFGLVIQWTGSKSKRDFASF